MKGPLPLLSLIDFPLGIDPVKFSDFPYTYAYFDAF